MKQWWRSRTIWAGLATIVMGFASLLKITPEWLDDTLAVGQIASGALTIYFRKTTKIGVAAVFADNRISGTRVPHRE